MAGLMPKNLAAMGRGGDTEVGHLTPGELVVPDRVQQQPDIRAKLIEAFEKAGVPIGRYTVGGKDDSRNPKTGMREYYDGGDPSGGGDSAGGTGPGGGEMGGGGDGGGDGGGYGGGYGTGGSRSSSGGTDAGTPSGGSAASAAAGAGGGGDGGGMSSFNSMLSGLFAPTATDPGILGAIPGMSIISNPAIADAYSNLAQMFGATDVGPFGSSFNHDTGTYSRSYDDGRGGEGRRGVGTRRNTAHRYLPTPKDNYGDTDSGVYTPPQSSAPSWQRYLDDDDSDS